MHLVIDRASPIQRSARVMQLEGIFDVAPSQKSSEHYELDLPLDERKWNIGLIVGSSGSGKSTIAREAFGRAVRSGFPWPKDAALVDGFPKAMGINDITGLLSSVGFSSPPLWMRPFGVLSNGEQMRVTLARMLAELPTLAVMDEFTSVVDRRVAQIGASAVAKAIRRRDSQFVAVTCHYDVEDWLQPDWVYRTDDRAFEWRSLQRRPELHFEVARVHTKAWDFFKRYHYLSAEINRSSVSFVAFHDGYPVGYVNTLPFPGRKQAFRISRVVVIPEYQGVGLGMALMDWCAALYTGLDRRMTTTFANPALRAGFARNPSWVCIRQPSISGREGKTSTMSHMRHAVNRFTTSWRYVGPAMDASEAAAVMERAKAA